ncbi:DUF4060 family protein [Dickeya fangzhongdai]|uniref:DUF4060 family protein n=1 Tax=Dickeya fangzhongdai TaxID=1778540 RepID=UPI002B26187D|nr:DUF4060 family protein [Dickeya fangzhongdai]WOX99936.1 DUF4060 family protein [Dickeya fangzhongdai]WOY04915.1 DUF4060 family protein [Dickeya fangzhongdai]
MKLINRAKSPLSRQACDCALAEHYNRFGEYGRSKTATRYRVRVASQVVTVEVIATSRSYVATALDGVRRLSRLPGINSGEPA